METYPRASQGWKHFISFLYASLQICLSMNLLLTDSPSSRAICLLESSAPWQGGGSNKQRNRKSSCVFPQVLIKPLTCMRRCGGNQDSSRMLSVRIRSAGGGGRSEHVHEDEDTEGN